MKKVLLHREKKPTAHPPVYFFKKYTRMGAVDKRHEDGRKGAAGMPRHSVVEVACRGSSAPRKCTGAARPGDGGSDYIAPPEYTSAARPGDAITILVVRIQVVLHAATH